MTAENKTKVWKVVKFAVALVLVAIIVIGVYYLVPVVKDKSASKPAPVADGIDVEALQKDPSMSKMADAMQSMANATAAINSRLASQEKKEVTKEAEDKARIEGTNQALENVAKALNTLGTVKPAPSTPPITVTMPPASNEPQRTVISGGQLEMVKSDRMSEQTIGAVTAYREYVLCSLREIPLQEELKRKLACAKVGEVKSITDQIGLSDQRLSNAKATYRIVRLGMDPSKIKEIEGNPVPYYDSLGLENPEETIRKELEAKAAQAAVVSAVMAPSQVRNTEVTAPSGSKYYFDGVEWIRTAPTVYQRPCATHFTTTDGRKVLITWHTEWDMVSVDGKRLLHCWQLLGDRVVTREKRHDGFAVYDGLDVQDYVAE